MVVKLRMQDYLRVVAMHGVDAPEMLGRRGFAHGQIEAKAMKASRKGYIDFGVAVHRGWLTPLGLKFIGAS